MSWLLRFLFRLTVLGGSTMGFSSIGPMSRSVSLHMAFIAPPPVQQCVSVVQNVELASPNEAILMQGAKSYLVDSSSQLVSLQERKIPTKEEVESKKRNFAFWFWGGGFVAPFLATFYYFGFKFWER
mmetsp:Transcript_24340/g.27739  ORF Transcript_24340/g.27739 Transcript_24340/m.27739 type:complete len:127 (-) Transcript_24340:306-686(-)